MDIAKAFGAEISVERPDPSSEGYFFVKRRDDADHETFMIALLGFLGTPDRLVMHHRTGFAVVQLPFGRAERLKRQPKVAVVGGIQFNPEQFAAVTGAQPPR